MRQTDVEIARLQAPATRPAADAGKLARHGAFDWGEYTPIIVEQDGQRLTVLDGMTRVENAQRAGIARLPAFVFIKR